MFKVKKNKNKIKIYIYTIKQIVDSDNDGYINLVEFKKCIRDYRIDVTDPEIHIMFNLFDP